MRVWLSNLFLYQLLNPHIHGLAGLQLTFTGAGDDQFIGISMVQTGGLGANSWTPLAVGHTTFRLLSSLEHGFAYYSPSALCRYLPGDACITHLGRGVGFDEFARMTLIRDPARGYIQGDKITIQAVMRVAKLRYPRLRSA